MKLLSILVALFLLTVSFISKADPYAELEPAIGADSSPEEFRELWKHYLDSDRLLKTKALEERYPETVQKSGYTKDRCDEILGTIDDDIREHKMFLGLHHLAMRCHVMLGQDALADQRAAFIASLTAFIAGSGTGDEFEAPLWIGMPADVTDFLTLAGYEVVDRRYMWKSVGEDALYVVTARDSNEGAVRDFYFDTSHFLDVVESRLEDEAPAIFDAAIELTGKLNHLSALRILAYAGDAAASAALGDWADYQFGSTSVRLFLRLAVFYYRQAAVDGSGYGASQFGMIALATRDRKFIDEAYGHLLDNAGRGLCSVSRRLMSFYDLKLTDGYDQELMDSLAATCLHNREAGDFYLEYARHLDKYDHRYPNTDGVVASYLLKAGNAGAVRGFGELGQRHLDRKEHNSSLSEAFRLSLLAADKGDGYGANNVGYMYGVGKHVEKDIDKATHYYQLAAELEFPMAMRNLAWRYREGDTVEKNLETSFELFLKSAEKRNSGAMFEVGRSYLYGTGVAVDYNLAFEWFEKAGKAGNPEGWLGIGYMQETGLGVPEDKETAATAYRKALKGKDVLAEINLDLLDVKGRTPYFYSTDGKVYEQILSDADALLPAAVYAKGVLHLRGQHVEKDSRAARELFRKAADLGVPHAAVRMAHEYKAGVRSRIEWLERANRLGSADAAYELASFYMNNDEHSAALEYFQRAYELGIHEAAGAIGRAYEEGKGVDVDLSKAVSWYSKELNVGCIACVTSMAWMYYKGVQVPKDVSRTIQLYELAAQNGSSEAVRNLGKIYRYTSGHKDLQKAIKWLLKDIDAKDGKALVELGKIYATVQSLRNLRLAEVYFEEAAIRKNPTGMQWLAYLMEGRADGESEILETAVTVYEAAVSWGNPGAANNLALMYISGNGVPKDEKKAIELLELAVDKGLLIAKVNLGWCLENGVGVRRDEKKAVQIYQEAAAEGSIHAMYQLYMRSRSSVESQLPAVSASQLNEKLHTAGEEPLRSTIVLPVSVTEEPAKPTDEAMDSQSPVG